MNYKNIYTDLEPNRNFYTVWARLPKDAEVFIHEYLSPIKDSLLWASTYSKDFTSKIPHITLRYLGYLDELNRGKINLDVEKFKKELNGWKSCELELGNIDMYYEYSEGKLSVVRLFWKIQDTSELKEVHERLLKVEGYDFFSSLEGENIHPHISLGNIDPTNIENMNRVIEYIEKNKVENKKYLVKDIELNLCGDTISLLN
jgi:2'-5' RNA ligase